MIHLFPKISLTDTKTWVEPADLVCISAMELPRAAHYLVEKKYLLSKTVLISGIIPDESEYLYSELLGYLPDRDNLLLTTSDCATYLDNEKEDREENISFMLEENAELFANYKKFKFIGLLKGVTADEYEWVFSELKDHCKEFMLYLSGYIRSNPRWFNLPDLLHEILPNGFKYPLWSYGFNNGSVKYLSELQKDYNIQNAITESYRNMAVYEGNPHYSREVRMQAAWEKKLNFFQSNV